MNDSDRWIEAILGGRLRFHATAASDADHIYWSAVYARWAVLYRVSGNPRQPGRYAYDR